MNIKSFKSLLLLFGMQLFVLGCNGLGNYNFGDRPESSNTVTKEVSLQVFTKIENRNFNFGALGVAGAIRHLAASEGTGEKVLYLADASEGLNMWSWRADMGNIQEAWKKILDFTGRNPNVNFALPANQGRTIKGLEPVLGGVAVAISPDSKGVEGGLAVFSGLEEKAAWSSKLVLSEKQDLDFGRSMVEVYAQGRRALYIPYFRAMDRHGYISWLNLDNPTAESVGYLIPLLGGAPQSVLKFDDGKDYSISTFRLESSLGIGAAAALPDGRVVLATPTGLLTITAKSVGVSANEQPRLEQRKSDERLDPAHWQQFWVRGKAPTRVGAMRMVGDYLLITFVDNGSKNGGFRFAKYIEGQPLKFATNLEDPYAQVARIVVNDLEARLISMRGNEVYSFRDGKLAKEFEYSLKRANIAGGLDDNAATLDSFLGGATGDVPSDGTVFYDAAFFDGAWYYATDKGVFKVEARQLTRRFNKATKQAL